MFEWDVEIQSPHFSYSIVVFLDILKKRGELIHYNDGKRSWGQAEEEKRELAHNSKERDERNDELYLTDLYYVRVMYMYVEHGIMVPTDDYMTTMTTEHTYARIHT